ncbi:MAG: nitroreductase [Porticoccaceae bacterium]|nr:nitroreductase [Porticoccaceae bacterium]OUS05215.1 oxidoreductase [Gammaproteobacteria bacterium 54_18_T64]
MTAPPLTFDEVIAQRKSVRGFLPQAIPEELLQKIFVLAQQAPSNCNIQPWNVAVASGASCKALRDKLVAAVKQQVTPNPDHSRPERFEGVFRKRQVETAVKLYDNMNIARDDKEGRQWAMLRNFELFDAPHIAFISMPKIFNESVAIDVGMYAQTLMLSMTAHGIGSCAQASVSRYPDIIREHFGLDDSLAVLIGISFGFEDTSVPANRTIVPRANIEEDVLFLE